MLPSDLRKINQKQGNNNHSKIDYLANAYTYSSMRKIVEKMSRKKFSFDEYDIELKRQKI